MNVNVIPPFSDDVRLSVDEYRNKLYEIMTTKCHHPIQKRFSKDKYHARVSQSEGKLDNRLKPQSVKACSDSKLSKRHESPQIAKPRLGDRNAKSYVPQFDSRSRSRGIITQSALVELRAAGMR